MSNIKLIENELWKVANDLRTNSQLWLQQFSEPVLGLIFLKYADIKFWLADEIIQKELSQSAWPRWPRPATKEDYLAKNVIYLPAWCRYADALNQPESNNMGEIMNTIMRTIEQENPDIAGILPKSYHTLHNQVKENKFRKQRNALIHWFVNDVESLNQQDVCEIIYYALSKVSIITNNNLRFSHRVHCLNFSSSGIPKRHSSFPWQVTQDWKSESLIDWEKS